MASQLSSAQSPSKTQRRIVSAPWHRQVVRRILNLPCEPLVQITAPLCLHDPIVIMQTPALIV